MTDFDGRAANEVEVPVVKTYEGIGELVVGGSNKDRVVFTALALLNNPLVNQYLLDNKLKLQDRFTKTMIFPRDGMSLPNGEVFKAPVVETISLDTTEVQ